MRGVGWLLVVALAGCERPTHVSGHHPEPGFADGELVSGEAAFFCDADTERCTFDGEVLSVRSDTVLFNNGSTRRREAVLPLARLAVGDVVEREEDGDWLVITAIGGTIVAGGQTFMPADVRVPTARADALDRYDRRLMTGVGAVCTLLAIGLLVLARWLQLRVKELAGAATIERRRGEHAEAEGEHAVLRCEACGRAVALAATPTVRCPGCHGEVVIPADYGALVASRREIGERLPREAAALRHARIVGHPLFAAVLVAAAYGSLELAGAVFRATLEDLSGSTSVTFFLVAHPLGYMPVVLGCLAVGQLFGAAALARRVPALAAVRVDDGYGCRGCGAPLGETRDGVAALCLYCGVQNVIAARLAASAARAKGVAEALQDSIRAASASFWARVLGLLVPLLYVIGVVGLVVYPILLAVGLTT